MSLPPLQTTTSSLGITATGSAGVGFDTNNVYASDGTTLLQSSWANVVNRINNAQAIVDNGGNPTILAVENSIILEDSASAPTATIQSMADVTGDVGTFFGLDYETTTDRDMVIQTSTAGGVDFRKVGSTTHSRITNGSISTSTEAGSSCAMSPTQMTLDLTDGGDTYQITVSPNTIVMSDPNSHTMVTTINDLSFTNAENPSNVLAGVISNNNVQFSDATSTSELTTEALNIHKATGEITNLDYQSLSINSGSGNSVTVAPTQIGISDTTLHYTSALSPYALYMQDPSSNTVALATNQLTITNGLNTVFIDSSTPNLRLITDGGDSSSMTNSELNISSVVCNSATIAGDTPALLAKDQTFTGSNTFTNTNNSFTFTPHSNQLPIDGFDLANKAYVDSVTGNRSGNGITFYLNKSQTLNGYGTYSTTVDTASSNSVTNTNMTTTPIQLVAGFITIAHFPEITTIPIGIWQSYIWGSVSATTGSLHYITRLYKYSNTGVETLLASSGESNDINAVPPNIFTSQIPITTPITILTTDRLLLKIFTSATGVGNGVVLTTYFEGINYSYSTSTIGIGQNLLASDNNWTGTNTFFDPVGLQAGATSAGTITVISGGNEVDIDPTIVTVTDGTSVTYLEPTAVTTPSVVTPSISSQTSTIAFNNNNVTGVGTLSATALSSASLNTATGTAMNIATTASRTGALNLQTGSGATGQINVGTATTPIVLNGSGVSVGSDINMNQHAITNSSNVVVFNPSTSYTNNLLPNSITLTTATTGVSNAITGVSSIVSDAFNTNTQTSHSGVISGANGSVSIYDGDILGRPLGVNITNGVKSSSLSASTLSVENITTTNINGSAYPPVVSTPSLSAVMAVSNSVGTNDLDMNHYNILNCENINTTNINGTAYPPTVSVPALFETIAVNNDANAQDITNLNSLEVGSIVGSGVSVGCDLDMLNHSILNALNVNTSDLNADLVVTPLIKTVSATDALGIGTEVGRSGQIGIGNNSLATGAIRIGATGTTTYLNGSTSASALTLTGNMSANTHAISGVTTLTSTNLKTTTITDSASSTGTANQVLTAGSSGGANTWLNPSSLPNWLGATTASATYQPISGMSSYLTIASASSTYQTISAMTSYLLTVTANATFQTISGMSAYLTTASASSTYQTLAGMSAYLTTATASSTYQTITNMANYALLAGATFTGTVASPLHSSTSGSNVGSLSPTVLTITDGTNQSTLNSTTLTTTNITSPASTTLALTSNTTSGGVSNINLGGVPMGSSGGQYSFDFTGQSSVQMPDTLLNNAMVIATGTAVSVPAFMFPTNPRLGQTIFVLNRTGANIVFNGNGHNLLIAAASQGSYTITQNAYTNVIYDGSNWVMTVLYTGSGSAGSFKLGNIEIYGNGNIGATWLSQQTTATFNMCSNATRSGDIGFGTTSGATNTMSLNTGSTGLVTISKSTGLLSLPSLIGGNFWSYTATNGTQTFANNTAAVVLWQQTNNTGSASLLTFASGVWTNASGRTLLIQGCYTFVLTGNATGTRVAAIYAGTNNTQYGTYGSPYTLTATNWTATSGFCFSLPSTQSFSLNGFQSGVAGGLAVVSSILGGAATNISFTAV